MISIIVPVYNIEKYIAKCIESIIEQTYESIEVILVDDGSTDRSGAICDTYEEKDNRIHVIHKSNGGLSDARNTGLDSAQGEFIMFVDGDDYISPYMCEKLLSAMLENNADIAVCNFQRVYAEDNMELFPVVINGVVSGHDILEGDVCCWAVSWGKLYRRKLFESLRFPLGKINEDGFVFFDLMHQSSRVVCIEDALYYYLYRHDSIMNSPFSVRRLDGCEAAFQRADKMIDNGYSSRVTGGTIRVGIDYLCKVFDYGLYKDSDFRVRYKELLHQFRSLGFIRLLRKTCGKNKVIIALCYMSPKAFWKIKKQKTSCAGC